MLSTPFILFKSPNIHITHRKELSTMRSESSMNLRHAVIALPIPAIGRHSYTSIRYKFGPPGSLIVASL